MIQNLDTTEDRKQQQIYFTEFQQRFWKRLAIIHNNCARIGLISDRRVFAEQEISVNPVFNDPAPVVDKSELINNIRARMSAGLMGRKQALRELNKNSSDKDIENMIREIDEDAKVQLDISGGSEQQVSENDENGDS